jgi:2-amino-4-hydroxy-6-hydroxymethyldihydropteridine diphosphokinase/dihydropteroate synthase
VENKMGRVKVIDKGPRNIDLDILLFARGDEGMPSMIEWNDERLILPHKLMFEREFVLRPLYEYAEITRKQFEDANSSQDSTYRESPLVRCKHP